MKQRGTLFAHFFNGGKPTGAIVDATMYEANDDGYYQAKLVAAFTVAELGEMLKRKKYMLIPVTVEGEWQGADIVNGSYLPLGRMDEVTEADARAKMLIYLIENKLIEV